VSEKVPGDIVICQIKYLVILSYVREAPFDIAMCQKNHLVVLSHVPEIHLVMLPCVAEEVPCDVVMC